ncbi:LOG family protein [Ideonella livida]|uniref:Cytokinin riboside 5'-monophosphate phosphoribohydrolase n=1 Tax=Ideonella livida TaxID=2707176 RepID=A0A7C9TK86_9BURK|nr:TIGR00730 family Rossman fold protein [Ideonella livida]NDY90747.1 TIGR00730 family Rossman fold protein [Ideonella livida]
MPTPFTLCVYCGSRPGAHPAFIEAARAVGTSMGRRGWRLVYGGGNVGLMGIVADACLQAGGAVVGVIPERLMAREVGHHGLTELHVVQSMHQRKQKMAELSHGFLALPGGIGTLEELFEVWTWRHLGYHGRPIALLNVEGFYDPLQRFLEQAVCSGFMDAGQMDMVRWACSPEDALDALAEGTAQDTTVANLRAI